MSTLAPDSRPAFATPARGERAKQGRTLLLLTALLLVAIPPRFVNLGELSFYADEELSALAARSVAQGEAAQMPTGMPYRRALPLTWLAALSARLFGEQHEFAYRLPAAIFGALTVPLMFVAGRAFAGGRVALIAAVLLALSEWHLVYSRQARMYAPLLFLFLATAYAAVRWANKGRGRDLWLAAGFFAAATTFHLIGVLAVMFLILPLLFMGGTRPPAWQLLGVAAIMVAAALAYDTVVVSWPYEAWGIATGGGVPALRRFVPDVLTTLPVWAFLPGLAGGAMGIRAAARTRPDRRGPADLVRSGALFASAAFAGVLVGVGQLYGAALAGLSFLLIHPAARAGLLKELKGPILVGAVLAAGWAIGALAVWGPARGIRFLAAYPFPYIALLGDQFTIVTLLFVAAAGWLACRAPDASDRGLRIAALAVILTLAGFGMVSEWKGTRYLLCVYPFLLLAASAALVRALEAVCRRVPRLQGSAAATGLAIIIAAAGVLDGHGVPQAVRTVTLEHGQPVNRVTHIFPFRPDHRSPGEFVRRVREPGDVVIAEDPLQQHWYAGPIDYWFRRFGDARRFLFQDEDGRLRDFYVGSEILRDPAALDAVIEQAEGRVWLVTSGETFPLRTWYLSAEQRSWLESLEGRQEAAYVGLDAVTRVYCLNCADRSAAAGG